jgi:hypothetical protein
MENPRKLHPEIRNREVTMAARFFASIAVLTFLAAPAPAEVEYQFGPDGSLMQVTAEDSDFSHLIGSLPEGVLATFCLESTTPSGSWFWQLEGYRSGGVVTVTGGFIDGTICDAPYWDVTGGSITRTSLQLNADHVGEVYCMTVVDMSGVRTPPAPLIWSGTYGFPNHFYEHDTEFLHIGSCP